MMNEQVSIAIKKIMERYKIFQQQRIFTIAISGIDAGGKGYISKIITDGLQARGMKPALISTDPWQNKMAVRLKKEDPAVNLYKNIFRWNDMFDQLISPLQEQGSINLAINAIHTDRDIYYPLLYNFRNIDMIILEAVFLFRHEYLDRYDYRIWIGCSFKKGIQRARNRNAENLDEKRLLHDYNTYYYPAQEYHFKRDRPVQNADLIIDNN